MASRVALLIDRLLGRRRALTSTNPIGALRVTGNTGDPWGTLDHPAWSEISPRAAENLAAILGAVNSIASTISSLPCFVVSSDDSRAEAPTHPLQKLIDYGVNENESWADYIEGLLASVLLRGNALSEIITDNSGRLVGLETLPWTWITPLIDDAGQLLFDYLPTVPPNAGQRRRLTRDDVLFVKDRSDNGLIGVSRLQRAAGALQIALELQQSSATFLFNGAKPGGALTSDRPISDANAARFKQDFQAGYEGRERGRIAVLGGGVKFETFSLMSAEDMQIIGLRNFSVADVCRVYSVPPWLLADPIRATLASATAAMRSFTLTGLMPWVKKIEAAFAQSVLSSSFALHFDVDALIKSDISELYTALLKGRQGGWLTPNDARGQTGFSALPEGNDLAPPVSGGLPADGPDTPAPPEDQAPVDDASKVARLDQRRALHASD
jgi:HK97 family phage portal protein